MTQERARAGRSALAILALGLAMCGAPSGTGDPSGSDDKAAAGVSVEFADLDRIHAVLAGLRDRPVFVNFWATWCVPCVEELPDLASLSREEAERGTAFIGVSLDAWVTGNGTETEDKVRRALADAGVGYVNLIYRGDQDPLLEGFQLPGPIPYSVLFDGRGRQAARWEGKATIGEVRQAIARASKPGPSSAAPPRGERRDAR